MVSGPGRPPMTGMLLLRADDTEQRGWGRVARQLALGRAWTTAGGEAVLLAGPMPAPLGAAAAAAGVAVHLLRTTPMGREDGAESARLARSLGASVLSVDLPRLSPAWLRATVDVPRVVFEPVSNAGPIPAEFVVDGGLWPRRSDLIVEQGEARRLQGPAYAVLPTTLQPLLDVDVDSPRPAARVVVFEGAGWPTDFTRTLVSGLGAAGLSVTVHSAHPQHTGHRAWADADLAVAASDAPLSLLAFLGIPILLADVTHADEGWAGALASLGVARWTRPAGPLDPTACAREAVALAGDGAALRSLADAGRALVDGRGADRVVAALEPTPAMHGGLRMVPASWSDRGRLFGWANDPGVRARAFDPRPIPWTGHLRWLRAKLASPDCRLLIGWSDDEQALGPVRFDRIRGEDWEITVALDPEQRGRRWAAPLISAACVALATRSDSALRVRARIRSDNLASVRAFSRAGFGPPRPVGMSGVDAVACWWSASSPGGG